MGLTTAADASDDFTVNHANESIWGSENYLFRIDSDLWDNESTKRGNGLFRENDGESNAAVSTCAGGRHCDHTLSSSDNKLKRKVSPGLEDIKTYLELFTNVYGPGVQLGRNKPDVEIGKFMGADSESSPEFPRIPFAAIDQASAAMTSPEIYGYHGESSSESTTVEEGKAAVELNALFGRLSAVMTSADMPNNVTLTEIPAPMDEFILRELTVIRELLLRRFFVQRNNVEDENLMNLALDPESENDLFEILGALTEEIGPSLGRNIERKPHFPVGEWTWTACQVCFEHQWLYKRACCGLPVCDECLKTYFSMKVNEGQVKIECCNSKCRVFVHRDEISACLDSTDKEKFYQFLASVNSDPYVKTCPRCSHVTVFPKVKLSHMKNTKKNPIRSRLDCSECNLTWCFNCHAPWHPRLTCRQYRKGDRLMKSWANEMNHGQLNAQKCPRCQVYIQRTTGCDHMHCSRCKTDFCYRCGDRLRKLRFFGDHYSKLSIFGCKYRYKADQPLQRKFVRGAVFGSKLMVAPILGTLGACAGVIALGFGIFVLPVYGGVRLYQKFSTTGEPQLRTHLK